MGSVEVDATVKSQRHSLSKRDTGLYTGSTLQKAIIDLDKLNPDTDGDGKLSDAEVKIYNLLRAQDTDGDGKLNLGELYNGLAALTKVEKKRSVYTKGFFVLLAVSLIQVLLIVGLVAGIFVAMKDQHVANNTLTGSSGAVLKTGSAEFGLSALGSPDDASGEAAVGDAPAQRPACSSTPTVARWRRRRRPTRAASAWTPQVPQSRRSSCRSLFGRRRRRRCLVHRRGARRSRARIGR